MEKKLRFKVVIAGSRTILDRPMIYRRLDKILGAKIQTHNVTVISGCAKGPDTLGAEWAIEKGLKVEYKPADWSKFGREAGMLRNQIMCNGCDAVIAFHDKKSSGTANMIHIAKEAKRMLRVIEVTP